MNAAQLARRVIRRLRRARVDRKAILTEGLELARMRGLEIAPQTRATLTKQEANVLYLDRSSREQLLEIHKGDPNVDPAAVLPVDIVTADRPMPEVIGEKFDYIIASHVIEHVPNLVDWFRELDGILAPGGTIRLAIPDKRFTFDRIRRETNIAEVMLAHMTNARAPLPWCVLDNCYNARKVDHLDAWDGLLDDRRLETHEKNRADALHHARRAMQGEYVEIHVWVFTPRSTAILFQEMAELGVLPFKCVRFVDTPRYHAEFFLTLARGSESDCVASWRAMEGQL